MVAEEHGAGEIGSSCYTGPLLKKNAGHSLECLRLNFLRYDRLCLVRLLVLPSLIPERELDAVPEAEFIVDYAEVVFDNVFGSSERICNFSVLAAFGDELDDGVFSGIGAACIDCFSDHSCLL